MKKTQSGLPRRTLLGMAAAGAAAATVPAVTTTAWAEATSKPVSGTYRIDLHGHTLPPDYRAALMTYSNGTIGGYPIPEWSPERAIDFMDRYGIQAQVLSVSDPGVGFLTGDDAAAMARYCNEYVRDVMGQHPTRFGGFAVLPMPNVDASVAELRYALDNLGMDGVVLLSSYNGVYLGDPQFNPIMAELEARQAYVFVHSASPLSTDKPELVLASGRSLPDFLYEYTFDTTRAANLLMYNGVRDRYPSIRFQLAHAGGTVPYLSWRLGLFAQLQGSSLDVAGHLGSYFYDTALSGVPAAMRSTLEVTGVDNVVFGSDWPMSEQLFTGSGDPQPQLSEVFSSSQRYQIERLNGLAQLPRLAAALS